MRYLFILFSLFQSVFACDFCGCSASLSNADIIGIEMQSFVSSSLMYRKFEFKDETNNIKNSHILTNLWQGSYAPKKWVDVRVNFPIIWIKNNYSMEGNNLYDKNISLGDIQLISNFVAWQKQKTKSKSIYQKLNLGLGIELPTGKKISSNSDILQNINFGSQSVDFLFNGLYALSVNNWSIVQQGQVKINTYNQDKFKFGNNYAYQLLVNYITFIKKSNLIPSLSTRVDIASKNLYNSIIQDKSGMILLSLQFGFQWSKKNYHVGCIVQQPIYQNTSNGLIEQKTLTNLYFKYQIKLKKK